MDGRHGQVHGSNGRMPRPLSEVPASALNRRPVHMEAPKPLAMSNVWDAYGTQNAHALQGFNITGMSMSMTTDDGKTGLSITGPNEVTMADGRRIFVPGGIHQMTVSNGQTFISGIHIDQIVRENQRLANL